MNMDAQEELQRMMKQMSQTSKSSEQFKIELDDSLVRYYSAPEMEIELDLADQDGNIYKEHEAFGGTFSDWQQINSIWDRRSVLYELWDKTEFEKLRKWQIVERYLKDRDPIKAVDFQRKNITTEDLQDIRLIVALSKLYRVMDYIKDALHYSKGAYELRPDLDIVKTEYASALHLSDIEEDKELSHKLFNEVLKNKTNDVESHDIALLNFFVFSPSYIDSSVYAASFLHQGNCDLETWEKMADEYYWCPVFRFEHSSFLSSKGESLRAMAKLNSLANEFPWFKVGVLANIDMIQQLRSQQNDPNLMQNEMKQMEEYKQRWSH